MLIGSLGPVHDKDIRIFADNYVRDLNNLVVGAEDGSHYINANLIDFKVDEFGDFRFILDEAMALAKRNLQKALK